LESDGKGITSEGFAINDSRPSPEITRQGPQIQPLIQLPGIAGNDSHAVGAHVFGQGLLRWVADIETAEIDSYGKGNAFFHTARNGLHETPHGLAQNGLVDVGGGNDSDIIRLS